MRAMGAIVLAVVMTWAASGCDHDSPSATGATGGCVRACMSCGCSLSADAVDSKK